MFQIVPKAETCLKENVCVCVCVCVYVCEREIRERKREKMCIKGTQSYKQKRNQRGKKWFWNKGKVVQHCSAQTLPPLEVIFGCIKNILRILTNTAENQISDTEKRLEIISKCSWKDNVTGRKLKYIEARQSNITIKIADQNSNQFIVFVG